MLCEDCGKNAAEVHIQTVINGESTGVDLCHECLAKRRAQGGLPTLGSIGEWLASFMDMTRTQPRVSTLTCGNCGISFEKFKETGMLGCAQCYTSFRAQLAPMLSRIHGQVQHEGRVPAAMSESVRGKRELERLKAEMGQAVEREDFEAAAQLRDRIREMSELRNS